MFLIINLVSSFGIIQSLELISNADENDLPNTIKTENTIEKGIKINLIDYTTEDSPYNYPGNQSNAGINGYTDLYFFRKWR